MSSRRLQIFLGVVACVITLSVIGVVVNRRHFSKTSSHGPALYYCPMHPTYTSDRPGDCPICNMKLVKKEEAPPVVAAAMTPGQIRKQMEDICYLHNCHKLHEGRPCPMMVVAKAGEKVDCPICGSHIAGQPSGSAEKRILYWTDPMIPGYKADGPGKSPMGMDLVPVYAESEGTEISEMPVPEGYATVLLTPQKQQLIGIKTAPAVLKRLNKIIRAAGTIAHDPELYQVQAEYLQAIAAFDRARQSAIPEVTDQAQRLVESTKIRLKHMGLSDDLIQEMGARTMPEHGLLFSSPGQPVWLYAKVYEYEIPFIKTGQDVNVDVPSLPGAMFNGKIRAIDPMVEPATRTVRIRAQLEDPQGQLKPDMYVNVTIAVDLGTALAIPSSAVFDTGAKKIIFVDKGEGLLEPRDVVLGGQAEQEYHVQSGILEGEIVVTSGNFLIDSESRMQAAFEAGSRAKGTQGGQENVPSGGHQHGN